MNRIRLFLFLLSIVLTNCKKDSVVSTDIVLPADSDSAVVAIPTVFDLPADSSPRFAGSCYIDLSKITRISRFRSGIGHDYSDDFEFCRSMKHYFDPGTNGNDTICIYSPVKGKVVRMFSEWAGNQVQICSEEYPAFTFVIFHVNTLSDVQENVQVESGQLIGYHIGNMTMSDIAVRVSTTFNGPKSDSLGQPCIRYFSYFHVMTDSVFSLFVQRGISARSDMVIGEEERNLQPLDCNGEYFQNQGTIANWFDLQ